MGLGWTYLTPTETLALRRGKLAAAIKGQIPRQK
jgi:hypothetical protein